MTGSQLHAHFRGAFGSFRLDAAFSAPLRGVTAVFGPSGCGKTTVLRCVAGLVRVADGRLDVGGDVWQDSARFAPTHRRPIGYVFQEANLFPHLSVRSNLLYGRRGAAGGADARSFEETVALLGLANLLKRSPRHLSGGERQRVAIGRALLSRPKLLLMDEPLAALDGAAKEEILTYLEHMRATLDTPILYVSHDLREVERLADHLVLMEGGRVTGAGALSAIESDLSASLAHVREAAVTLDARVDSYDAAFGMLVLSVDGAQLAVPSREAARGAQLRLRILANDISLAVERPGASTIVNILPARIESFAETGPHQVTLALRLGEAGDGARLIARVTRRSFEMLRLEAGLSVFAQVKAVALARFRADDP